MLSEGTAGTAAGGTVEQLARAAAAGDSAALERLLAAIQPDVLRVCGRFLPCRQDAEEACQDTLMAVARGIGGFAGRSSLRTWYYRIAANRSRSTYDVLRRRSRELSGATLPEPADPRRTSVVAGTRIDLLEALAAISPLLAEAVTLRDVLEVSYREISESLGIPEGTAKTRVRDGRLRLRELLGGRSFRG
ncbi:RNA polymerase sigma factor [Mangrovihabitans endophyticus]|nr:RNA polymerase sigma factor [Mangrovihabitans endophyticus]